MVDGGVCHINYNDEVITIPNPSIQSNRSDGSNDDDDDDDGKVSSSLHDLICISL